MTIKAAPDFDGGTLTVHDVVAMTTYSKNSIYKMIRAGEFPAPTRIGENRVAWSRGEVLDWLRARVRRYAHEAA
jgi:prophage regulatory protein